MKTFRLATPCFNNLPASTPRELRKSGYICSAHLCTALSNFLIMESNYWKYTHQFPWFVNNVPVPTEGFVAAPELPGLGAEIRPELFRNGDAIVETVARG